MDRANEDEAEYQAGNPRFSGSHRLIVVSGCSGGGKSSLLSELARRGYEVFPEPGRQIVKEQLHIEGEALPWKDASRFTELCLSRALYFFNMARPDRGPVFFDRSIVDALTGYSRLGLEIPPSFRRAAQLYRYAETIFLTPPWKELFANDCERRHSFADAVGEYEALCESYPSYGYRIKIVPKLSVSARADFILAKTRRMAGQVDE